MRTIDIYYSFSHLILGAFDAVTGSNKLLLLSNLLLGGNLILCSFNVRFRHQIQHYTGQLAKDTSKHLRDLNASPSVSENRQWRLQKERLHSDFTKALNNFQGAQRTAAQKEKEAIKRAKQGSGGT